MRMSFKFLLTRIVLLIFWLTSYVFIIYFEKFPNEVFVINEYHVIRKVNKSNEKIKDTFINKYQILVDCQNGEGCQNKKIEQNTGSKSYRITFSKNNSCSNDFLPSLDFSPHFHVVFSGLTYAFSAYLDTRLKTPLIRIVGISDFWQDSRPKWCRIWYKGIDRSYTENIMDDVVTESHGKRLIVNLYSCRIQHNRIPYAVSLIKHICDKPESTLPVIIENTKFTYNISVCVPPIFNQYNDFHQFREFIKVNQLFGASQFTFYNMSIENKMNSYLTELVAHSNIKVIDWKVNHLYKGVEDNESINYSNMSAKSTDIHYNGQLAAQLDCFYRNFKKSRYILFLDLDEILVPRKWTNLIDTVRDLIPIKNPCALIFQNVFFHRNDFIGDANNSNGSLIDNIKSLTYLNREFTTWRHGKRSKYLADARFLEIPGVHTPLKCIKNEAVIYVKETVALLHHYRMWSEKVSLQTTFLDDYMLKFMHKIISSLNDDND